MKIIGLTGPSGAGKSTLCSMFEEMNIPCINTDEIYHAITNTSSECLNELVLAFGEQILNENGTLDRRALAKLVFEEDTSKENLSTLNHISHKYVWNEVSSALVRFREEKKPAAVIDAPALFSSQIFVSACDFIISVIADKDARVERIVERDGISPSDALARIEAQPNDEFFIKNSEYYIDNSGDPEQMKKILCGILQQEGL